MSPLWMNWFENPISVQFNHRISAYLLTLLIVLQWFVAQRSNAEQPHKTRTWIILLITIVQVIVGIVTIVLEVPLYWALAHQGVAFILLAAAVAHWRGLVGRYPPVTELEERE